MTHIAGRNSPSMTPLDSDVNSALRHSLFIWICSVGSNVRLLSNFTVISANEPISGHHRASDALGVLEIS